MAGRTPDSASGLAGSGPNSAGGLNGATPKDEPQRADSDLANSNHEETTMQSKPHRGARFWAIITSLAVTSILSALEGTIVSTALPTVVQALGGGELYLWVVNGYFLPRYVYGTER